MPDPNRFPPDHAGTTHWDGCHRSHPECAYLLGRADERGAVVAVLAEETLAEVVSGADQGWNDAMWYLRGRIAKGEHEGGDRGH